MSIFDKEDHVPVVDPNADHYAALVGDDKAYKDNAALARAVAEKEAFIQRVLREKEAVLDELRGRERLESLVDQLAKKERETPVGENPPPTEPGQAKESMGPEDLHKKVEETLRSLREKETREVNEAKVRQKLREAFGANAEAVYKQKASELGGEAFLNDIAARNPEALFRVLGIDSAPQRQGDTPPRSAVNTGGFRPQADVRNKAYYDNLRKTMPSSEYWSARIQNEIHEQAAKLGPSFYE